MRHATQQRVHETWKSSPEEFVIIRVILSGQDSLALRVTSCGEGWRQNPCNSAPLDCQVPQMLVARAGILPDPLPKLGRGG